MKVFSNIFFDNRYLCYYSDVLYKHNIETSYTWGLDKYYLKGLYTNFELN